MNKHFKKLKKLEDSEEGVNVEDILKLLPLGDTTWIKPLKEFAIEAQWQPINKEHIVPLLTWVEMVCVYFEAGLEGLCKIIEKKDKYASFALGVIEEFQTLQALEHMVSLGNQINFSETTHITFLKRYTYSLNQISNGVSRDLITITLHDNLNELLKNIIDYAQVHQEDSMRASAIVCLGNCGTLEDIDFLKTLSPLDFPYKGIEKKMIRRIQKSYS